LHAGRFCGICVLPRFSASKKIRRRIYGIVDLVKIAPNHLLITPNQVIELQRGGAVEPRA
jgi:hypothetical protein